jgi:hypothetical protein
LVKSWAPERTTVTFVIRVRIIVMGPVEVALLLKAPEDGGEDVVLELVVDGGGADASERLRGGEAVARSVHGRPYVVAVE